MTQEDALKDVWYFWNHSFYNRIKPSRKISANRKGPGTYVYEVKCYDCGKTVWSNNCLKRNIVLDSGANHSKIRNSSFICKDCYKIRRENLKKKKEKEHAWYRSEKVGELIDSIEKFDDLMLDCQYNTCDILAAHRELLKDDDNRLRTDFILGLICGEEKKKKYLEHRK